VLKNAALSFQGMDVFSLVGQ